MLDIVQDRGRTRQDVRNVVSLNGLDIGLVLGDPQPGELFAHHADLAVVSDALVANAFWKVLDPGSTAGGSSPIGSIVDDFERRIPHRAENPIRLLHLPAAERVSKQGITRCCSVLSVGTPPSQDKEKLILLVPSLVHAPAPLAASRCIQYAEAALHVAAFAQSRSIYFAGFGAGDGCYSNESIVRIVARMSVARHRLRNAPSRVYFKYSPGTVSNWIERLAADISRLEREAREVGLAVNVRPNALAA